MQKTAERSEDAVPNVLTLSRSYLDVRPITDWERRAQCEDMIRREVLASVPDGMMVTRERYLWYWSPGFRAWTCRLSVQMEPVAVERTSEIEHDGEH